MDWVIVPPEARDFSFQVRLAHCYPCRDFERVYVKVDGKEVGQYVTSGEESRESTSGRFSLHFADTKPHAIEVDYEHRAPLFGAGITLEWVPPPGLLQRQALEAAKSADLVVAMIGLSPELEGEEMKVHVKGFAGGDRTDIQLPEAQLEPS